jgi:hypothetical protein
MKDWDWKTIFWATAALSMVGGIIKRMVTPRQGCISRACEGTALGRVCVEGCYDKGGVLRYHWVVGSERGPGIDSQALAMAAGWARVEELEAQKHQEKEPAR